MRYNPSVSFADTSVYTREAFPLRRGFLPQSAQSADSPLLVEGAFGAGAPLRGLEDPRDCHGYFDAAENPSAPGHLRPSGRTGAPPPEGEAFAAAEAPPVAFGNSPLWQRGPWGTAGRFVGLTEGRKDGILNWIA